MESQKPRNQRIKRGGGGENEVPRSPPLEFLNHNQPSPRSSPQLDLHHVEISPPHQSPPLDLHHVDPSPLSSPLIELHDEQMSAHVPLDSDSSSLSDISDRQGLSPPDPHLPKPKKANATETKTKQHKLLPPSSSSPYSSSVSSGISDSHVSSPQETYPPPPTKASPKGAPAAINRDFENQKLGESRRRLRPDLSTLGRSRRQSYLYRALLGSRLCGFVACLVSFSLTAANRNQGWALDSFYHYKELRYCLAVTVIGFLYSGYEVCDLACVSSSRDRRLRHKARFYFDFAADQKVLAYLLASASSSVLVRVEEWEANWGSDKFPSMAKASAILSLVAFVAFGFSSLFSGYALCNLGSTL